MRLVPGRLTLGRINSQPVFMPDGVSGHDRILYGLIACLNADPFVGGGGRVLKQGAHLFVELLPGAHAGPPVLQDEKLWQPSSNPAIA